MTLAARERGAIVRPLGDVIVLMPPLSIEPVELRRLVEITRSAIADATGARCVAARCLTWISLVGLEVFLASAADRAEPRVGDIPERRPGRDSAVGIALGGVIDVAARIAEPANGLDLCTSAHRRPQITRLWQRPVAIEAGGSVAT